jgi:hypothetical protein
MVVDVIAAGPEQWLEQALGLDRREADPAIDHRDRHTAL